MSKEELIQELTDINSSFINQADVNLIDYFKNYFFAHVINEWKKLDPDIRGSSNYHIFRNALLKFVRLVERKIFNINDPFGI